MGFFSRKTYAESEMERLTKSTVRRLKLEREREREAKRAQRKIEQAEARRKAEIQRLKRREESFIARAREREALSRKRRAEREASRPAYIFGEVGKGARKVRKAVGRKRRKPSKIGWF